MILTTDQREQFPSQQTQLPTQLLEQRQSNWQQIEIHHHPIFGNQLIIDGDLQISEADLAYNSAMTAPLLTLSDCRDIAILGGGDGGVLNEILMTFDRLEKPCDRITLIDIDGDVIDLCQRWMPKLCGNAFNDPRAQIIVGDAFAWIDQARNLDAVIYDLTMDPVREGLSRSEFIQDILGKVHRSLRPGGVFSMQACGEWLSDREQLLSELRASLGNHFTNQQEQTVVIPSYVEMWTFLTARKPG